MKTYFVTIVPYFQDFMRTLSESLAGIPCLFGLDNAPVHKDANFEGILQEHEIRKFFVPYSSQLNPCEGCFSVLKASIKGFLTRADPANDRITLTAYRQGLLEIAIEQARPHLTIDKIRAFNRHVNSIALACSRGEPLAA